MIATGRERGVALGVLEAVHQANEAQKRVPLLKLRALVGELRGAVVAVWGTAFKAQTDDMREAASLVAVEELLAAGAAVVAHDPKALDEARRRFGDRVRYAAHRFDALKGADALLVLTEWQEYRVLDLPKMKSLMKRPIIVDARNLYEPARLREAGFRYASIGRP